MESDNHRAKTLLRVPIAVLLIDSIRLANHHYLYPRKSSLSIKSLIFVIHLSDTDGLFDRTEATTYCYGTVKSIVFLCLACLVLQSTPLRACAWEELALGNNCHDRSQEVDKFDAERVAMDGCVSHPADQSHQCVCERPKASTDRAGVLHIGVDMLPVVFHAPALRIEPVEYCLNFAGQKLLEPCPPARIKPLLN